MSGEVLIIEADDGVAHEIADAVGRRGFSPRITADGKDGYDLALSTRPAAIVLCAELPRVSGYSICAKLKKDPVLKDVPLLFTSAEASESTFEHHKKLKVRADEYLSKPFAMNRLIELLGRHVELPGLVEDDEISISEDIAIEPALHDVAEDVPVADVDPFAEDGGFRSADIAFDAALEAISEHEEGAAPPPAPSESRPVEPPAPGPAPAPEVSDPTPAPSLAAEDRSPSTLGTSSLIGQKDVITLKKELNAKDRELFELRDQIHAKDRELLGARERETELEGQIVNIEAARAEAEQRSNQLEERQRETDAARSAAERRAEEAEARSEEAAKRARDLEQQLEDASRAQRDLETGKAAADAELERLREELQSAEKGRDEARTERDDLEAQRTEHERRLREAEQVANRARGALESGLELLRQLDTNG